MAEQLKSFNFSGPGRPKGVSKYDQYLDGNIYRLVFGEDIPSSWTRATLIAAAKRRGLKVRTQTDVDALVIQAYTPNGDST